MTATESEHHLFFKLNLAQRILLKWVDREMTEIVGATTTQIAAILYLMEHDGCLLVDLSRELLQNKSAITTLVERMVKNDLITRRASCTDGRATQLYLTAKGRTVGLQALPYLMEYDTELTRGFSSDEIQAVNKFLDVIMQRFEVTPSNYFRKRISGERSAG